MLKAIPFANAFTVVGIALYVICRILTLLAPDFLFSIGQSWFHTFSLNASKTATPLDFGTFLIGGVTFGIFVWLTSYAGANLYNKFAK
ncbi:MAG: DUF5676 family membrane protein [Candidatus Levybacteria bacterium]|nr:DUF5676 family membrane protein [Candidatus Levybacteria bacterium]